MPTTTYRGQDFGWSISQSIKLSIRCRLVLNLQHLCECRLRINSSCAWHIRDILDLYISSTHHPQDTAEIGSSAPATPHLCAQNADSFCLGCCLVVDRGCCCLDRRPSNDLG